MSRLLPFLAFAFALATFFLYIRPTYSDSIVETRKQIKSYDDALVAAERFSDKEAELTQSRAQIPADSLARLNAFLPDGVDNVQLILDMDALAARSGMTLSDFNTQADISGSAEDSESSSSMSAETLGLMSSSPIDSINLTFSATGSYGSFRTFLAGIENSLRPLDVISVDVEESATGVYTYGMTVRIYWLR